MRIGIDGGCWNVKRGYGRFLRELVAATAGLESKHQFLVFLDRAGFRDFPLKAPFQAILVDAGDTVASAGAASRRKLSDLLRMSLAVRRERLDVFFFPSVYSWFPLLDRTPTLLGIHDTIADRNPEYSFATSNQALMWKWKCRLAVRHAKSILTVSEYSKRCIEAHYKLSGSRIHSVYEGASAIFRPCPVSPPETRFVLYVGGISPNKNLEGLIRAYSQLKARERGLKLVLVGEYLRDSFMSDYTRLTEIVSRLELKDEVQFAGFVPDPELRELYNQAALFAMPSFDEGFGLPALEAMACGAPVVVSTGNSLEEVVGSAGLCVDPRNVNAIAQAMDSILLDDELARRLRASSLTRAAEFSWERCARQVLALIEEIA